MDDSLNNFMRNITELRLQNGLSKRQMAALLGVSVRTITRLERGDFPPNLSVNMVFRIQKHFGVTAADQWK